MNCGDGKIIASSGKAYGKVYLKSSRGEGE